MKTLYKNVTVYSENDSYKADILVDGTDIADVGADLNCDADLIYDCTGLAALPALCDIHVHFRDPGQTYKEDVITGCAAAAAGGFTAVCCMPNTKPVCDSVETARYIMDKAAPTGVKVYPVCAVTKGMNGEELADQDEYAKAGIKMISDDGRPVENAEFMRKALEKSKESGLLVASHCEDLAIINGGIMHKGEISEKLGVKGMDRASEDSITAREIALADSCGARIHICHVSTKGSIGIIRDAKKRGIKVTCETAPHYMMFTHEKLLARDADYRMNPPLREEEDRRAVLEGVLDGTVDCIVTDHAPHAAWEKESGFLTAPNGIIGLETAYSLGITCDPGELKLQFGRGDVSYAGVAYNVPDAQTQEAMHLLARTEAIFVDPCYTGKSFHGFVDLAQNVFPKGSGAIYLHTGGIPAIWTKEHLDAAQPVLAAY